MEKGLGRPLYNNMFTLDPLSRTMGTVYTEPCLTHKLEERFRDGILYERLSEDTPEMKTPR